MIGKYPTVLTSGSVLECSSLKLVQLDFGSSFCLLRNNVVSIATAFKADGQSWIDCLNYSSLKYSLNCGSAVPSLMYAGMIAFISSETAL